MKKTLLLLNLFSVFSYGSGVQQSDSQLTHPPKEISGKQEPYEYICEQITRGVNSCAKMSAGEGKIFLHYSYQQLLEDRKNLFKKIQDDSITLLNADAYINMQVVKYVSLYHQFKSLKGNYMDTPFMTMSIDTDGIYDTIRPDPGPCQPACTNVGWEDGTLNGWIECGGGVCQGSFAGKPGGAPGIDHTGLGWGFGWTDPWYFQGTAHCSGPKGNLTKAVDLFSITGYNNPDYNVLVTSSGNDAIAPYVPRVCPMGGKHSIMLGDSFIVGLGAATIEQKFKVTKDNANFTYMYAAFIENPSGHGYAAQPWFKVDFLDEKGDTIKDCGYYFVVGGPNLPGFKLVNEVNIFQAGKDVYVKDWSCVYVPLRKYLGQCVTVQFTVGDCTAGAHFAYVYLDAKCGSLDIKKTGDCKTKTLTAPVDCGIATYEWLGPGIVGDNTGISVTVNKPGIYKLIMASNMGGACADTLVDTVNFNISALNMSIQGTNVKCHGDQTGSATVTVAGNISDYTFSWTPVGGTGITATGLGAGTYSCKIHSSCADTTISVTITEPPVLTHSNSSTPSTCGKPDGSASTTEGGGTSPYTYSWNTGPVTPTLSNIKSGYYTLTIKDANGCKDTNIVHVPGGGAFNDAQSSVNVKCYGGSDGSALVTSTGGSTPYVYSWMPGGQNTSAVTGLTAGTYTCVIHDNSPSCSDTIKITITQPTKLVLQTKADNVICHGDCNGKASVIVSGATPPYSYSWSTTATADSIKNVCAGTYSVIISDKNNCPGDTTVVIKEPSPLSFTKTVTPTICGKPNGSASVTASGGTPVYIYSWTGNPVSTPSLTNINAGTYSLTVTDSKGCRDTVSLVVPNKASFSMSAVPASLLCFGDSNGSLTVNVAGTSSPYIYSWSNGATTGSIKNLSAGKYSITVTDKDGCSGTLADSITQPAPLILQTSGNKICSGESTTLTGNANGGTSPYNYVWNNSVTAASYTVSPATTEIYTLDVTDANGCKISKTDSVIVTPMPQAGFSGIDVCVGIPTVFKDSSFITGGTINSWVWNFGDGTSSAAGNPSHTYTKAGTYTVSLSVSIGACQSTVTHVVNVYQLPHADFAASPQPTTILNPTITFTDLSYGGVSGTWDLGDGTTDPYVPGSAPVHTYPTENLPGGEMFRVHLNIVNQYGCPDTISKLIHIDPEWTFYVPNTFTPNGDGKNDLFFGTGIGIIEKEMWIFDRWGNQIFHTKDLYGGWDGKVQQNNEINPGGLSNEIAQEDTYVWLIIFKEVFLKTHRLIGHVNIIK